MQKKNYVISLLAVLAVSSYPIYMGASILTAYFQNGAVSTDAYPRYVIPYAPICIAVIITAALMPVFIKFAKKFSLPAASLLGGGLFLVFETLFEQIRVINGANIAAWQLSLCVATPQVLRSLGQQTFANANPAFKIHFYIIALLIVLAAINCIHGFSKLAGESGYGKKAPLYAQLVCLIVFIGLCVLACFTAFFRNGTINISPLSALLMSVFFIVFGITAGVYAGSILYGRKKLLSQWVPAIVAALTAFVMYIGELVLMGGELFRFGGGVLFAPFLGTPFAIVDIVIIALSGIATYFITGAIKAKEK